MNNNGVNHLEVGFIMPELLILFRATECVCTGLYDSHLVRNLGARFSSVNLI